MYYILVRIVYFTAWKGSLTWVCSQCLGTGGQQHAKVAILFVQQNKHCSLFLIMYTCPIKIKFELILAYLVEYESTYKSTDSAL